MKATCYLEVEPIRNWSDAARIDSVRVVRMTKGTPSLAAGNIAVRIVLDVPAESFEPAVAAIVVNPSRAILAAEQIDAELEPVEA